MVTSTRVEEGIGRRPARFSTMRRFGATLALGGVASTARGDSGESLRTVVAVAVAAIAELRAALGVFSLPQCKSELKQRGSSPKRSG